MEHKQGKLFRHWKIALDENFDLLNFKKSERLAKEVQPLKMIELRSIFITYFVGILVASVALIAECYAYHYRRIMHSCSAQTGQSPPATSNPSKR